jgi:hypothetical protein
MKIPANVAQPGGIRASACIRPLQAASGSRTNRTMATSRIKWQSERSGAWKKAYLAQPIFGRRAFPASELGSINGERYGL